MTDKNENVQTEEDVRERVLSLHIYDAGDQFNSDLTCKGGERATQALEIMLTAGATILLSMEQNFNIPPATGAMLITSYIGVSEMEPRNDS